MTPESIALQLGQTGLCVCPNFLSPQTLQSTAEDLQIIQSQGHFNRAKVGQGYEKKVHDEVRRDETYWLNPNDPTAAQSILWDKLNGLKKAFNQFLYLGLQEIEGHYASYPIGGFYKRHLDCFHQDSDRMVSIVLYLNQSWKLEDGGQLRVYNKNSHTDINPVGGTMACFMSRESEHEVLKSHSARTSFSGWFKTKKT